MKKSDALTFSLPVIILQASIRFATHLLFFNDCNPIVFSLLPQTMCFKHRHVTRCLWFQKMNSVQPRFRSSASILMLLWIQPGKSLTHIRENRPKNEAPFPRTLDYQVEHHSEYMVTPVPDTSVLNR